jgi:hypothetical protein
MFITTRGLYEETGDVWETDWGALVAWFQNCAALSADAREDLPLFVPGSMIGGVNDRDVKELSCMVLDFDGRSQDEFLNTVSLSRDYSHCIYTSYNHGVKEGFRYRVIIPFDRPVSVEHWNHVWKVCFQLFGSIADSKCKNVSRAYFLPATNPKAPSACWIQVGEGATLCVDRLLATPVMGLNAGGLVITDELEQSELITARDLGQLASKLERRNSDTFQRLGRALKKAILGEAFAVEGHRNDTTYALAGEIAKAFPRANADKIGHLFAASLELQGQPTVQEFVSQVRRQQARKQADAAQRRGIKMFAQGELEPELVTPEAEQAPAEAPPNLVNLPAIVQKDGFYWFRAPTSADFAKCYGIRDARVALFRDFGAEIQTIDANGQPRGLEAVLIDYSYPLRHVIGSYTATQNTLDPEALTLTLATARKRPLIPTFHEPIDQWLRLLFPEDFSKVCEWIATLGMLDRAAPALLAYGASNAGKSLLSFGLARIWENEHTRIEDTIGQFNASLKGNPLVIADEGLPEDMSFTWLRSFLTSRVHKINEKYRPTFDLHGCVRMYVSANNAELFAYQKTGLLSAEDADAIGQRFLLVKASKMAVPYIEKQDTHAWVKGNLIAEHALWIYEQLRHNAPGGRWAVLGSSHGVANQLARARYGWFVQLLCSYLESPEALERTYGMFAGRKNWPIRTQDGVLYVSQAVLEQLPQRSLADYRRAVDYFGGGDPVRMYSGSSSRCYYHPVNLRKLRDVADLLDVETAVATVAVDSEVRLGLKRAG